MKLRCACVLFFLAGCADPVTDWLGDKKGPETNQQILKEGLKKAYDQCVREGAPSETCEPLRRSYERMK